MGAFERTIILQSTDCGLDSFISEGNVDLNKK
jgi:hypothetical protein